jgi:hypothetical protein
MPDPITPKKKWWQWVFQILGIIVQVAPKDQTSQIDPKLKK